MLLVSMHALTMEQSRPELEVSVVIGGESGGSSRGGDTGRSPSPCRSPSPQNPLIPANQQQQQHAKTTPGSSAAFTSFSISSILSRADTKRNPASTSSVATCTNGAPILQLPHPLQPQLSPHQPAPSLHPCAEPAMLSR